MTPRVPPRRRTTPSLPAIERRHSRIQGWGVFAIETIPKNKRIVTYDGQKITNQESLTREIRYPKKGHIWCFKLNRLYVRDAAVGGNIARYINHSCTPNCYTRVIDQTIWIIAARTIRKGEELTYDYCTDGVGSIQCRCRPGCKTMI
jgi:SET domain-containing protein